MKIDNLVKRSFDLIISIALLILLSPLMIIIAIVIKISSNGSVLYLGVRTGYMKKKFKMFKYRTMVVDGDKIGGPSTGKNDPRITPIGRFLRRYKLDELPQLFNVFLGQMSIVGPRPEVPEYTDIYKGDEKKIFSVRPGLTDYSSVKFVQLDEMLGSDDPDYVYENKVKPVKNALRVKYAKKHNFFIDLKIIFMTITAIIFKIKWNIEN